MSFVLDTSVTMAWCFADEATKETEALLEQLRSETALVPPLWGLEVANVLLLGERRSRLTELQTTRFLNLLHALPITIDTRRFDQTAILATARHHRLSAYDASYLLLAETTGLALATLDKNLAKASKRAGITVLP